MLVAVHPGALWVVRRDMSWTGMERQAGQMLSELRDAVAPGALTLVETDQSVPDALERVARLHHRDLLVVGSSLNGPDGCVRIGTRTRQLLGHAECALAVAPRGLSARHEQRLAVIGVGFDGGPEAREALARAASLARAAGATLRVLALADERFPTVGLAPIDGEEMQEIWDETLEPGVNALREEAERALSEIGIELEATIDVATGSPSRALAAVSQELDLLVIGSHHWGAPRRSLLASTGETLMHDALCPVMAVPLPA